MSKSPSRRKRKSSKEVASEDPPIGTELARVFDFVGDADGIEEYRLKSNGLQVLYMRQGIAPVATTMITYRVGSRNESAGLTGATHFLEHLMFKGTERFNRRRGTSIFEVLQSVGAQVNATTWLDRTNYYEMMESEHLSLALDIESDRMRNALLNEEDVESERTVILNEFDRGENESQRRLFHLLWSTAFIAHPYRHPTIGWRSDIESVTAADLRNFYDTYYWPNNATLSIIGGVERVEALKQVADRFGPISSSPLNIPDVTTREPLQSGERRFELNMSGEVGSVVMGYHTPGGRHGDADALGVLSMILSGGKTSRFYRALTDTGLAAYAHASSMTLRDSGLFILIASPADGIDNASIESALDRELDRVIQEGVEQGELSLAKKQVRTQTLFGRDSSYAIAAQLNEAIATGDWRLYAGQLDRVEALSKEDIDRVARTYLAKDARSVGYLNPVRQGT